MTKAPKGYDEIGEGLAQAVAEGHQTRAWMIRLAALAGYGSRIADKWLAHYRELHAYELQALDRRTARKSGEIEALKREAEKIRQGLTGRSQGAMVQKTGDES